MLLRLLLLLQACDGARQVCRCPSPEELDADLDLLYRCGWATVTACVTDMLLFEVCVLCLTCSAGAAGPLLQHVSLAF